MALTAQDAERELLRTRKDPIGFVERTFGEEVIGKQTDILRALARPNVTEIHVKACHDPGKTHICARAVPWFLACWPHDSIVLTTAPTWPQVENLIWREIRDGFTKAKVALGGRPLMTSWEIEPKWYALGIATSPETAVNIQGYHASHVLVIVDEADGVPQAIWDAIDGLTTSKHVIVLAIGNPINPQSAWRRRFNLALNNPTAVCIQITADDVLNLTDTGKYPFLLQRAWVDDKKRRWGESSALYIAKVLAEWPDQGSDTLIPVSWLERARIKTVARGPRGLGWDIASSGSDRSARALVEGNQLHSLAAYSDKDTMVTAGRIAVDIDDTGAVATWVDRTGVGVGVVDRLVQLKKRVTGVENGSGALDPVHFANRGSELRWNIRRAFEDDYIGLLIPDREMLDQLVVELNRSKFIVDGARIRVDKFGLERGRNEKSMTDEERTSKSPDLADAFVLAWNAVAVMLPNKPVRIITEVEREIRDAIADRDAGQYNPWTS